MVFVVGLFVVCDFSLFCGGYYKVFVCLMCWVDWVFVFIGLFVGLVGWVWVVVVFFILLYVDGITLVGLRVWCLGWVD